MMVGLFGLLLTSGCTPGPVTARVADDKMTGAGNTGGTDVRVTGRDAAGPEPDAAAAPRGAAGAGGASLTADAAAPADGARDGAAADASADGSVDLISARVPGPGEVAIDELLVNPTGDDLGREWIEIASRASEPLDLSQLHLATASTDVPAPAGTIAPGALLLLGQSADPAKNGGAPVAVAYGTKLILLNANGQLSICLGACASGIVIDTV